MTAVSTSPWATATTIAHNSAITAANRRGAHVANSSIDGADLVRGPAVRRPVRSLWFLTVLAAGACGASEEDEDFDDSDQLDELMSNGKADGLDWASIGNGVVYQRVNQGDGVIIAYGGYTARLVHSTAWATELVDEKLGAAGVGHIYAVKGPAQASYAAREIGNSKIKAHLATIGSDAPIYIVAHSSGSFVAHELLHQLKGAGSTDTLARISYANLDGGGSGLTSSIVGALGNMEFVYAKDPTLSRGLSQNSSTAIALGMAYAGQGATTFQVNVPNTGCASGAGWCLHDVVITHRPHNPNMFDIATDYTDFTNRPITTEYLDPFIPDEPLPDDPMD